MAAALIAAAPAAAAAPDQEPHRQRPRLSTDDPAVLHSILTFVGHGSYMYVAGVSKRFREAYAAIPRCRCRSRPPHRCTSYEAVLSSPATYDWACGGAAHAREPGRASTAQREAFLRAAGRHASVAVLRHARLAGAHPALCVGAAERGRLDVLRHAWRRLGGARAAGCAARRDAVQAVMVAAAYHGQLEALQWMTEEGFDAAGDGGAGAGAADAPQEDAPQADALGGDGAGSDGAYGSYSGSGGAIGGGGSGGGGGGGGGDGDGACGESDGGGGGGGGARHLTSAWNHPDVDADFFYEALAAAVDAGELHVVCWLHQHGVYPDAALISLAAHRGHFALLQWAQAAGLSGGRWLCRDTARSPVACAEQLHWALCVYSGGGDWSRDEKAALLHSAACAGNIALVRWLREEAGAPWPPPYDMAALNQLASSGSGGGTANGDDDDDADDSEALWDLAVFQWARERGCGWGAWSAHVCGALARTRLLQRDAWLALAHAPGSRCPCECAAAAAERPRR